MKLSVVMPVYNSEKFLHHSVGSVLKQSSRDFELVCTDDGGTDGGAALLDAFALTDSRLTVIHKPNERINEARFDGIKAARGEFIGFIDSDDIVHPRTYEWALAALEDSGAELAH